MSAEDYNYDRDYTGHVWAGYFDRPTARAVFEALDWAAKCIRRQQGRTPVITAWRLMGIWSPESCAMGRGTAWKVIVEWKPKHGKGFGGTYDVFV